MTTEELEDALLAYLAKDDSDEPGFQSLTTIYERLPEARRLASELSEDDQGFEDKEQLRVALDQLVADGMAESHWGERDYEASYRVTQDGFYQVVVGTEGLVPSTQPSRGIGYARPAAPTPPEALAKIATDSSTWTGKQFVLVDAKVIETVQKTARELHAAVHSMRFESNEEGYNLKGLVDALVAICDMAEPDVSVIDRILANPKFQAYASLLVFVATIRGAIGF